MATSRLSSSVEYIVPTSAPRMASRSTEMGHATGNRTRIQNLVSHTVLAPMSRPNRVQTDCGISSPKMNTIDVVSATPRNESVNSAIRVASTAFTSVLPSSSVVSSRLPYFRTGQMAFAHFFSRAWPPSIITLCVCVAGG